MPYLEVNKNNAGMIKLKCAMMSFVIW